MAPPTSKVKVILDASLSVTYHIHTRHNTTGLHISQIQTSLLSPTASYHLLSSERLQITSKLVSLNNVVLLQLVPFFKGHLEY